MSSLLLAVLLAFTGVPAQQTYTIAGVVLRPNGQPAKHVRVALSLMDSQETPSTQVTGENGAFRFENRPSGKFHLTAQPSAGRMQTYGQRSFSQGFGTDVVTGPDFDTSQLVFRLIPPAAICGRVLDAEGEPAESVMVQLFVSTMLRGKRSVLYTNYSYTDDRGEYRFGGLSDGVYYVAVSGMPWYSGRSDGAGPLAHLGFPATYYPNTREAHSAAPLVLKPGQEATADFGISVSPVSTLSVVPKGDVEVGVIVNLLTDGVGGGSQTFVQVQAGNAGQPVQLRGVQPGRYTLRARSTGGKSPALVGKAEVVVGNEDATIEIPLAQPPLITGKLKMVDGATIPDGTYIELENEVDHVHTRKTVAPDGTFQFDTVAPGSYRPLLGSSNKRCHLTGIALNGTPAIAGMVEIAEPAELQLAASLTGGEIRGEVYREGHPAPGVMAILAPAKESANPLDYHAFETDTDGSFEWVALPPGDYLLIVQADWLDLEYANPVALRRLLDTARALHVDGTETQNIRVDLK